MAKTKKPLDEQIRDADKIIHQHIKYISQMVDYRESLILAADGTTPPNPPPNPPGVPSKPK